jgi:hypothetical protein
MIAAFAVPIAGGSLRRSGPSIGYMKKIWTFPKDIRVAAKLGCIFER